MKVAVVSIMKDESLHVARWAESCKDATYRILLDTGSSDDSVALARQCGVVVHEARISPWHFGNARNHLLDLLPADVDWVINLDLDEVLGEDWHSCLSRVPNDGSVNRPRYLYTWSWKELVASERGVDVARTIAFGKPDITYQGDKITRRLTHRWKGACHEVNMTEPGNQELQAPCDIRIYHFPNDSKSRGGYLELLIQDVQEDPTNARNTFYLGREYMYRGMTDDSIRMLKHHLSLETAWWKPERGYACRHIAKQSPESEKREWLERAVAEYPEGRECWVDLAQWAHDREHWEDCYRAARRAVEITSRGVHYCSDSDAWGWRPHDLLALAAHRLGRHGEAVEHGIVAIGHAPADDRLRSNLHFYAAAQRQSLAWIPVEDRLPEPDHMGNAVGVLACLPDGEVCIGFCDNDEHGVRWHCQSTKKPTHWMPLPEPPEVK